MPECAARKRPLSFFLLERLLVLARCDGPDCDRRPLLSGRSGSTHGLGNPASCRRKYVREEVLEAQFTELLGRLQFDDEVLEWVEGARQSWRDSAGGSPAQVGPSKPPGSECCVRRRRRRTRSVHSGCVGCVIEPRNDEIAGAEAVTYGRTQHVQCRYARHCRPAGVEEHITRKWIVSEPGIPRVRPP